MKKIIGLTGGIGSGKTTVAKLIEAKGFPVYYSDIRAKEIVNDNALLRAKIIELLGENAYQNGEYNRKWIAEKVFHNDALLSALNALIHPAVKADFEHWTASQHANFLFKETALLFELGLDKNYHSSLLVTADEDVRIQRVLDRDDKTPDEVRSIIKKQMPESEKRLRADFIIENNGDLEELKKNFDIFLKKLS